ncbi:hypothetical protein OOK13_34410 [Streptomyces sp. NBC_00378]|uniref:ISAzo13-like element transposase-related protein n=1 Tax=unclassified Streptomyces TaxID=2593676 RepID=UPI00225038AC|nr:MULTISPECIES: hypothetical protein [unclassified Streptomyces]MCX5113458.1 hypothetical protein [Streptomyces sp. NBC_00378]
MKALLDLVEDSTQGDPIGPLTWKTKDCAAWPTNSPRRGKRWAATLLKAAGFSLRGNARVLAGSHHPDRDAQF